MLQESVAQAKVAGKEIALSLKSQISVLEQALPGASGPGAIAIQQRLSAARLELAQTEAVQMLAIKRASGVQLSLAEALRLKQAGLEYRSLSTVAAEAEAMKVAANRRAMDSIIQKEMEEARMEMALQDEKIAAAEKAAALKAETAAETVESEVRATTGALEWAQIAEEERTATVAAETAKRVALERSAQLAMLKTVAESGTSSALGHGGGPGGGISGIMRETLVIFREIGRGNMTRVPGSLLLLLQYTGMLNLMMKSEKTEALLAAAAQEKLAQSTARAALAAEAKVRTARLEAGLTVDSPELQEAESAAAKAAGAAQLARAEATNVAANSGALSKDAALANVAALELERDAAVKAGVAETLRARETAAAAATVSASAKTTVMAMALMALPVALLVAGIVAWYIAIKELIDAFHKHNKALQESEELTRAYNFSIVDQISLQEKLSEAINKTTEALRKMNEEKDDTVESAQEAAEALKNQADAAEKLYDAQTAGKILDVDIAEKSKKITKDEAIKQRADIKEQAIKDKAKMKQDQLDTANANADAASKAAKIQAKQAQAEAQAASDKINKSPQGIDRAKKLAEAEKSKKELESQLENAQKEFSNTLTSGWMGGEDKKARKQWGETIKTIQGNLSSTEGNITGIKSAMSPDEIAAADAMRKAGEKTSAANTLDEAAKKAAASAAQNSKTAPGQTAQEVANVEKQKTLDLEKDDEKNQKTGGRNEVTDRERIGLGAASSVQTSILNAANMQVQLLQSNNGHLIDIVNHLKTNAGAVE